jgi:hypothetical protein
MSGSMPEQSDKVPHISGSMPEQSDKVPHISGDHKKQINYFLTNTFLL